MKKIKIKAKKKNDAQTYKIDNTTEITQFECEYAKIKYESELRREDSIIQQSGNMQTAFSFTTAALFMIAPIAVEYRGVLSLYFFLAAFSSITFVLLISLFAATMAQKRKTQELFPDVEKQIKYIEDNEQYFSTEAQRQKYLAETYSNVQNSLTENNRERIKWVRRSMTSFYIALGISVFWFIVAMCKLI